MKKIEALFTPQKLDAVRDVLSAFGLEQFVVSELSAHGPELNKWSWGSQWHPDFHPRLRLEVLVDNEIATDAGRAILRAARTRNPVESAVTISTVEELVDLSDDQPTINQVKNPSAMAGA
jgi:nitrogen regulatory protein PII